MVAWGVTGVAEESAPASGSTAHGVARPVGHGHVGRAAPHLPRRPCPNLATTTTHRQAEISWSSVQGRVATASGKGNAFPVGRPHGVLVVGVERTEKTGPEVREPNLFRTVGTDDVDSLVTAGP